MEEFNPGEPESKQLRVHARCSYNKNNNEDVDATQRCPAHPRSRNTKTQRKDPQTSSDTRGDGGRAVRLQDSPVGVRGLVNDVLVGGQQGQSVLGEIHSHVSVPASIQTAADGERHGMKPQRRRKRRRRI
ncbi:hypothetical protein GOODEAATRI_002278 [Goodea atripinnis]|uniref:Uncharacterized protein n=1 Tax=Goodea atripinnis TaxID=208336 RepID=A0ABV0MEE3_9TELE